MYHQSYFHVSSVSSVSSLFNTDGCCNEKFKRVFCHFHTGGRTGWRLHLLVQPGQVSCRVDSRAFNINLWQCVESRSQILELGSFSLCEEPLSDRVGMVKWSASLKVVSVGVIFDILEPPAFQKYSIHCVLSICLCLCPSLGFCVNCRWKTR